MSTPPRKSMCQLKVAVTWGKHNIVHPSYQTYDICCLREIALRQLLARVANKVNARFCSLDNAESISVYHVDHINEVISLVDKRKRALGRAYATDLPVEGVYEAINNYSAREFIFDVSPIEVREGYSEVVNAFSILIVAQSLGTIVPPPRVTKVNTHDDILHNNMLRWLERNGVG